MNPMIRTGPEQNLNKTSPTSLNSRFAERFYGDRLAAADVRIGGDRPQDIRILDRKFTRALSQGLYGLREAYVDNLWDVDSLDDLTYRLLRAEVELGGVSASPLKLRTLNSWFVGSLLSSRFFKVSAHYDLEWEKDPHRHANHRIHLWRNEHG